MIAAPVTLTPELECCSATHISGFRSSMHCKATNKLNQLRTGWPAARPGAPLCPGTELGKPRRLRAWQAEAAASTTETRWQAARPGRVGPTLTDGEPGWPHARRPGRRGEVTREDGLGGPPGATSAAAARRRRVGQTLSGPAGPRGAHRARDRECPTTLSDSVTRWSVAAAAAARVPHGRRRAGGPARESDS